LKPSAHVIRQQQLELTLVEQAQASALQQQVAQLFTEQVVPAMDSVMSGLVADHEHLQIDRLEIDLGVINPAELGTQFSARVAVELEQALAIQRKQAVEVDGTVAGHAVFDEHSLPSEMSGASSTLVAVVAFFLRSGRLPWWLAQQDSFHIDDSLESVLDDSPLELIRALRASPVERVARRLVKQLQRPLVDKLLMTLVSNAPGMLVEEVEQLLQITDQLDEPTIRLVTRERLFIELIRVSPATSVDIGAVLSLLVEQLASSLAGGGSSKTASKFVQAAERVLSTSAPLRRRLTELGILPTAGGSNGNLMREFTRPDDRQLQSDSGIKRPDSEAVESVPIVPAPVALHGDADTTGVTGVAGSGTSDANILARDTELTRQGRSVAGLEDAVVELAEGIYLENAGLVLLWPYLPRLFDQLGLADSRGFLSEPMQERGVLILQQLVTGAAEFPENHLVLNKILCGWPIDEPVATQLDLTEVELVELNDLLDSLIQHWKALKNTSPAGLREAFLQRSGRLSKDDLGWLLIVNRSGHDILLDSLPWGIGLIRLPWMDQPLRVEW